MRYFIIGLLLVFLFSCETPTQDKIADFQTHFELKNGEETATYAQTIEFYINLAKEFPEINIQTIGNTDSGFPLHMVTFNYEGDFNFQKIGKEKRIILINNGIHPGESDGIDATMLLYRDMATKKITPPKNTVLVTIPIYNIGGALNRNTTTRVNQNGPKSYGFRGNTRNYDLNRDFIKADTQNARTFATIFHLVKPDIFIDNHVSNGADYQYTLTHLFTQHNKLGGPAGEFIHKKMMPALENSLNEKDWPITPYVNVYNTPPENGFSQFMDSPRYSTGYTTLWNTLGLMVETHMLKPYKQRVEGTYALLLAIVNFTEKNTSTIKKVRTNTLNHFLKQNTYPLAWEIDTTKNSILQFKGFKADTLISEITGFPRLKYDTTKPFVKDVVYQNYFKSSNKVRIPHAYLIKKGWTKTIELLDMNNIHYSRIEKDTLITVESYRIVDFDTRKSPYEGHYLHYNTEVATETKQVSFTAGDYWVPTQQSGIRYLLETLEPKAPDSFFNWNFFDPILMQKEGFSAYVFEDVALNLLQKDEKLRDRFLAKKATDTTFIKNGYTQLDWVFKNSKFYESAHLQYPIYRVMSD